MKSKVHPIWWWFTAAIVLAVIGLWAEQTFRRPPSPQQVCEAKGDWWDDQDRLCAAPIALSTITGRRSGQATPSHKP
jgi:hypothetical protein